MLLGRSIAPRALWVACLLASPTTRAEPQSDAASCQPSRGSLRFVGCSLAQQLGAGAVGASVTVVDLKSDRELPSPATLRERVQGAVTLALRAAGDPKPAERSNLRVELSIEKSGGVLRVNADVRRATGLWQRVRRARPGVENHAFVEAPLDAELRALIPPPPLVVSETVKLKAPERGIVALACGPLGADGGQELALVSRSHVRLGRIAARTFVERKKAAWSTLSPIAAVPLREPFGSAEITADGRLRVGLTDRQEALELSSELEVTRRLGEFFPVAGRDYASGLPVGPLVEQQSQLHTGAQLALGDADSDGDPELAYSADTLDAAKDHLTLVTLRGTKVTPRFDVAVPGISAIAICSQREGPGMAPIVIATGDELWLLR